MIVLFTDFGLADPYVGQVHAVLAGRRRACRSSICFMPFPISTSAAAYLLPVYIHEFQLGTVLCVLDPRWVAPLMLKPMGAGMLVRTMACLRW
jgi:S-adenosylmethionine hydrolase